MTVAEAERVRVLLRASLQLWEIEGTVDTGGTDVAVISTVTGAHLRVDKAATSESPVRWWVRWIGTDGVVGRSRPCPSMVGVLRTVRDAVGAAPGARVAIATASFPHPGEQAVTPQP
jgi:hypothetical protein